MTLIGRAIRETFEVGSWHEIAAANANEIGMTYGMLALARQVAGQAKAERDTWHISPISEIAALVEKAFRQTDPVPTPTASAVVCIIA